MFPGGKSAAAALAEPFMVAAQNRQKKGVAEADHMPVANR